MKNKINLSLITVLFFATINLKAQSILSKKIDVSFSHLPIEKALKVLEQQSGVSFAYNTEIFSGDSTYSANYTQTELITILDGTLGKKYAYREKGKYVIIKSTGEIIAKNEKFIYTISGYIHDAQTGEIIPFASIYDSATLRSTLSDANGFYEIKVEQNPTEVRNIGISKQNYRDTVIIIKPIDTRSLSIQLKKIEDTVKIKNVQDSGKIFLDKNALVKTLTSYKQRMQNSNIQSTLTRGWQVSFLPYLGTHGTMSGKVSNHVSLNILGGYNGGFRGAEFGGIFNIDRDTCTGAQFGGVYNLTAGPFTGGQFGGVANTHFNKFKGGQFAGVMNTTSGGFEGFQAAGVFNANRKNLKGVQAGGVINYSDSIEGAQIAGVINAAGYVKGTQISGVLNTARKVYGSQIGFLNLADSVTGVQIGFLSFSRTGVHQLEFYTNEACRYNVAIRTGSPKFYNILGASYNTFPKRAYGVTYGIGSRFKFNRKNYLHLNASSTAFYVGQWDDIPSLYKFSLLYEFRIFKQIGVIAGPTANLYYRNNMFGAGSGYKDPISNIGPLYSFNFNNGRTGDAWLGFHIGIALN